MHPVDFLVKLCFLEKKIRFLQMHQWCQTHFCFARLLSPSSISLKVSLLKDWRRYINICVNHFYCTLSVLFFFHLSWLLLKILLPVLRHCQIKPVKRNQVTVYFYEYRLCIINSGFTSMQIKSYDSDYMHFLSNMAYISQIIFNL